MFSILHDNEQHIQQLGWRRILKAQSKQSSVGEIHNFAIPELCYNIYLVVGKYCSTASQNYYEMVSWQKAEVTESPITRTVPDTQIKDFIETGDKPCHTQVVERLIKLVTNASASASEIKGRG